MPSPRLGIAQEWLDNPIFVKHLRSRMRRNQVVPAGVIVFVLCLLISYGGWQLNGFSRGGAFGAFLGLQAIILTIIGASQVSTSVGGARESGIIDFHRVSPLSPTAVTLGFFFGAPVREYLLFALTLPFTLICVANDAPDLSGFLQSMVVLFVSAWLLHALALLTAVSSKKPKAGAKGIVGFVIFMFIFGGNVGFMALSRATTFLGAPPTWSFFGVPLPWLVLVLLYSAPTLFFLMLAAVRKMQSERAHPYTKREAAICLAIIAVLALGGLWGQAGSRYLSVAVVYVLTVMGCVLIATVTPTLGQFSKGILGAARDGKHRVGYWDDHALNRVVLVTMCAIVLTGSTIAWTFIEGRSGPDQVGAVSYSITIAAGVLVVAYFGLALQFFQLLMARRGTTIMGLFLFLVWLVPLVVGAIVAASGGGEDISMFITGLSPVAGIALSTRLSEGSGTTALQAAAIIPPLIFVFLFNNLVTIVRRRVIASLHVNAVAEKSTIEFDPLAV